MAALDIKWLRVFVEIHRTRSVSLAAQRLGMAQARASGILAKLRRHFGDPLFARTSQGMEPTPYADKIYPDALQCCDRLAVPDRYRSVFDHSSTPRHFRICMTDISEVIVLPLLVDKLGRVAPGVTVEIERISVESQRRLESGDLDLAVGYMPDLEAGFYQQTLFRQGFVCLAARSHPRIQGRLTRELFSREGHVVVISSGTGQVIVEAEYARKKIRRNVLLRVPSFLGLGSIVATTELLTTVPQMLAEVVAANEAVTIHPTPIALPSYEVKLHWHSRYHADPGNVWIRNLIAGLLCKGTARTAPVTLAERVSPNRAPLAVSAAISRSDAGSLPPATKRTGRRM
jgi:DNA-binding transcriptional LysR family regulator